MKLTKTQAAALKLIGENPGRVIAVQRATGYLKINGNAENSLLKLGGGLIARSAKPVEQRSVKVAGETFVYDVHVWELTEAGRAALAGATA